MSRKPSRQSPSKRRPARRSRRAAFGVSALALAVALIALWAWRGHAISRTTSPPLADVEGSEGEAAAGGGLRRDRRPVGHTGAGERGVVRDESGDVVARKVDDPYAADRQPTVIDPADTERAIAEYRARTQYPPTSNRLRPDDRDLLAPDERPDQAEPSQQDSELMVLFTGNHMGIAGEGSFTSRLSVTRDGVPVPITITAASAQPLFRDGIEPVKLTYEEVGGVWTNTIDPHALGVISTATIQLEVWFTTGPGGLDQRSLRFDYTPTDSIPARFTGAFRDAIENGSLVIYAAVEVAVDGPYLVDCNLYGPQGELVAWTRFKGDLTRKSTELPLLFYGKLLRDVDVDPPFHIGQLRGALFVPGRDPTYDLMATDDFNYATRSKFSLDELTDAEWSDPSKDHYIDVLRQNGVRPEHPAGD